MAGETMCFSQLREILPCRESMILLDRVFVESENKLVGMKGITMNETFFMGHFPGHPIFPGVLQVEAISQLAEIGLWQRLDPKREGDIYMKELRKCKFRRPNNPGDRMFIELEIKSVSNDSAEVSAVVKNNSGVTCNAEATIAVRPKSKDIIMPPAFNEFDKSENSAMDVVKIMGYIPHRFPFLFVDYVSKMEGGHVTGIKNTTSSEPIFREHKDGYKVLMSSVQPEIVAQAGCIYMLSNEASKGKVAYFMSIEKSEFFHPVHPGDQLICDMNIPDTKSRFGKGEGCMIVNGKIVSKTSMMFAIVDA